MSDPVSAIVGGVLSFIGGRKQANAAAAAQKAQNEAAEKQYEYNVQR